MVCRHFAFAPFGRQIGICASCWMWFLSECLLDVGAGGRGSTEELAFLYLPSKTKTRCKTAELCSTVKLELNRIRITKCISQGVSVWRIRGEGGLHEIMQHPIKRFSQEFFCCCWFESNSFKIFRIFERYWLPSLSRRVRGRTQWTWFKICQLRGWWRAGAVCPTCWIIVVSRAWLMVFQRINKPNLHLFSICILWDRCPKYK